MLPFNEKKKWHKSIQFVGNFTINWCLLRDIRLPGQEKMSPKPVTDDQIWKKSVLSDEMTSRMQRRGNDAQLFWL